MSILLWVIALLVILDEAERYAERHRERRTPARTHRHYVRHPADITGIRGGKGDE